MVRGWMLVERIKMFHCLLSSLEQGVDGVGDHPQVWTRNSPPGTSSVWSQGVTPENVILVPGYYRRGYTTQYLVYCPPDDSVIFPDPPLSPQTEIA